MIDNGDTVNNMLASAPPEYWTGDGIHPTSAGHRVLADCWLQTVCG